MKFEKINTLYFTIALLILGLAKFYKIDSASIWLDEAQSLTQAQKSISEILTYTTKDQNAPLYFIMLHFWTGLFGNTEFSLRALSTLFSILTAPLIFVFARKYINLNTALFASMLFAFSDIHLYYAQEARSFSFIGFSCVVSFLLFKSLHENDKKVYLKIFLLSLVNSAMVYAHYISVFIAISQFFIALIFIKTEKKFTKRIFLSCVLCVLLFLLWVGHIISNVPKEGVFWLSKPNFGSIKGIFISFSGNKVLTVIFMLILIAGILKFIYQYYKSELTEKQNYILVILVTWTFLPIIATYLLSFVTPVFLIRYLLFSSIGMFLLIGYFISELFENNYLKISITIPIFFLSILTLNFGATKGENWIAAVKKVKELKDMESDVLLSAYYTNDIFSYYYFGDDAIKSYADIDNQLKKEKIYCVDKLDTTRFGELSTGPKLIVVQSHQIDADPENTVMKTVLINYSLKSSFDFENVKVSLLERNQ